MASPAGNAIRGKDAPGLLQPCRIISSCFLSVRLGVTLPEAGTLPLRVAERPREDRLAAASAGRKDTYDEPPKSSPAGGFGARPLFERAVNGGHSLR